MGKYWIQYFFRDKVLEIREKNSGSNAYQYYFFKQDKIKFLGRWWFLETAIDDNFANFVDNIIEGRPFSRIRWPAGYLQLL